MMGGTSPTQSSPTRTPRRVLHERSESQTNAIAAIRLVPYTPERLDLPRDEVYSRNPLPTSALQLFPPSSSAFYSEKQGYALKSEDDVSYHTVPSKAQPSPGSSSTFSSTPNQSEPASPTSRPKPLLKKRKHVAVNPQTKTFRVLDVAQQDEVVLLEARLRSLPSLHSQPSYDLLPSSSNGTEEVAGSSVSYLPDSSVATSPSTVASTPRPKSPISGDITSSSPWNYQLVGGVRKVPKTPDLKEKAVESPEPPLPLPPLPETAEPSQPEHDLTSKPSFRSTTTTTTTTSTASDNTNYKVYGNSSPSPYYPSIPRPSSGDSNYQEQYESPSSSDIGLPESNYEVYGDPSPSTSYVVLVTQAPAQYSQESLVVPPLQPWVKRPVEKFGYYKSRSRETLRTGSLTSISTILSQEAARGIVASAQVVNLSGPKPPSGWEDATAISIARAHMQAHPHQWSSQLSTVPSESDGATDRGSRSWSDVNTRRSSGFQSPHSRHLSSSAAQYSDGGHSRSGSLERPTPAFARGQRDATGSTIRMVEGQDEHGDGITDMPDLLRSRPSRTRLSGFYSITSIDTGRTSTMKSTASSRANSLVASSIPAWAKLYYGSGERRYLGAPGSSVEDFGSSRPASSFRSGSPDTANFPLSIYSPRRRPRETDAHGRRGSFSGSMEITHVPELRSDGSLIYNHRYNRRVRTSSIWSPHLRHDRRAIRTSVWEPPSVNWSTESGVFGRRNRQIVMFITGFIFPFSWLLAAFLPLPPNHMQAIREDHGRDTESQVDVSNEIKTQFGPMDESRYESARWWRRLNRGMAVVGVLIIAAIIVLAVIGVKQGWGSR